MKFQQPIGAVRDVKELEYMVALHQTKDDDVSAFMDGSIDASDVKYFLRSRYGIEVTKEQVRQFIFKGLAGGEGDEDCIDIVEIVSIMIIPLLVKVSSLKNPFLSDDDHEEEKGKIDDNDDNNEKKRLEPSSTIIADVLKCILMDISHIIKGDDGPADDTEGKENYALKNAPKLTPKLLKTILLEYDEFEMLQDDDLIHRMIADATGGKEDDAVFDVETFTRALTHDVKLYNTENETRHSTIMNDIFPDGFASSRIDNDKKEEELSSPDKRDNNENDVETPEEKYSSDFLPMNDEEEKSRIKKAFTNEENNDVHKFPFAFFWDKTKRIFRDRVVFRDGDGDCEEEEEETRAASRTMMTTRKTFSQIDFTADNVISWQHVTLVWLIIVFSYIFYFYGEGEVIVPCKSDSFGCDVAKSIVNWLGVMLELVILGTLLGVGLSMGNGEFDESFFGPLIGIISVVAFVFLPAGISMDNSVVYTDSVGNFKFILPAFGGLLLLLQIRNLIALFPCSKRLKQGKGFLSDIMRGSNKKASYKSKQAGIFKVNAMVRNAYDLHKKISVEKGVEKAGEGRDGIENDGKKSNIFQFLLAKKDSKEEDEKEEFVRKERSENQDMKEKLKNINQAHKRDKSTKERALENYSNLMDETQEVGGFFWAWKEFMSGKLQETEGIWLSSRLIGAVIIQLVTVGVLFVVFLLLFKDLMRYYSVEIPYDQYCYAELNYNDCIFPSSNGQYEGFGVCPGVILSDFGECENNYFEDITPNILSDQSVGNSIRNLEDTFVDEVFVEDVFDKNDQFYYESVGSRICDTLNRVLGDSSPCNRTDLVLYRSINQTIKAYESGFSDDSFCESSLSVCAIYNNKKSAICTVGTDSPFQFKGPTCNDYTKVKVMMEYYEENIYPGSPDYLTPEKKEVVATISVAMIVSTLVSLATPLVYIPSSIHTLMKFRNGVIPSLRDPTFLKYRKGLQNMPYLIGTMFWGLVATTFSVTIIVSILVFLLAYHVTNQYLKLFTAQIIGIVATLAFKIIFCMLFMKYTYSGFYRKRAASANVFAFALESWYLALTAVLVVTRVFKFLVATSLYVGRVDRPVLAEGLILDLDSLPRMFRQNLLSTDAHRHPYIELLGMMYLMKLRHRDDFATESGSAWRLIFVIALMPWLKKKRIEGAIDEMDNDKKYQLGLLIDEIFAGAVVSS